MSTVNVGINGFGRIGRCVLKHMLEDGGFSVVGINDLADPADLAYLLKYDSVYGRYAKTVESDGSSISVDDGRIPFFAESEPADIPWEKVGADIVLECTGAFRGRDTAAGHLEAGAKKVVISAPSDDVDGTFVLGVNEDTYDSATHHVVSMASCTTNCAAPPLKVLHRAFGVEYVAFTTVHAYTSSQSLVDLPSRKRRRSRAANLSIIPTTTGAAKAVGLVIPELAGRVDGLAMRVPVPAGSITDITVKLLQPATAEQVNDVLRTAAAGDRLRHIMAVSDEQLVSRDIVSDPHSGIVDATSTMRVRDDLLKLLVWYDNEWGYSARLADFARTIDTQSNSS
jgi:glyceraldehyde 3-phosphate dehydrogenase